MSFVRQTRPSQLSSRQKNKKKKKVPAWDNTTSDLSVHKATREELERRKAVHQSKNLAAVKADRQMRALMKANRKKNLSQDDSERSSLLQEILFDEEQMRDAISHSDRVMAIVKDLFGDDPRVKSGKANVTLAPGMEGEARAPRNLPDMTLNPSHLDVLSESVMDSKALNDVYEDEDYSDDSGKENQFEGFEGSLDLERFRRYIAKESGNKKHHQEKWNSGDRMQSRKKVVRNGHEERRALKEFQSNNLSDSEKDGSDEEEHTESRAINDTAKVKKKSIARTSEEQNITDQNNADLAKVIHGVQDEVRGYEQVTGKKVLPEFPADQSSGLIVFLVQTIRTLIHHLTEKEKKVGSDEVLSALKTQLTEQRGLIDALTAEVIRTQEGLSRLEAQIQGNVSLKQEHQFVAQSQTSAGHRTTGAPAVPENDHAGSNRQDTFIRPNHRLGVVFEESTVQDHQNQPQQHSYHGVSGFISLPQSGADVVEGAPDGVENNHLNRLRREDTLRSDQAIMLSPPRQRDRRTLFKDHGPTLAKRELFVSQAHPNENLERLDMNSGMAAVIDKAQVTEYIRGSVTGDAAWAPRLGPEIPMGSAFRPSMNTTLQKNSQVSRAQGSQILVRDQASLQRLEVNGNSEVSLISKSGDLPSLSVSQSLEEGRGTVTPPTDIGTQPLFHRVDRKLKDTSLMSTDSYTSYRSLPSMQGGEQNMTGPSVKQVPSGQLEGQNARVHMLDSEPVLITSEESTLNVISDLNRRIAALSKEHADAEERLGNLKKSQGLIYN